MKKIFLVDGEIEFLDIIQSITFLDKVDVKVYTSAKDLMKTLKKEIPNLIFLSLEINDVNEFIVHDILKKCNEEEKRQLRSNKSYVTRLRRRVRSYNKCKEKAQK